MSGEREQNWYPIGKVGWFTQHIREGIEITAGQLTLLQPALAQPYRLDDATVARIIRVHQDPAGDLVLFQNQADRWNAEPGLTPAQHAAVREYEAAIGELRRLNAEVLAAAGHLKPVTIEALLARSDLEVGIETLPRGWPGTGFEPSKTRVTGYTRLRQDAGPDGSYSSLADAAGLIRAPAAGPGMASRYALAVDPSGFKPNRRSRSASSLRPCSISRSSSSLATSLARLSWPATIRTRSPSRSPRSASSMARYAADVARSAPARPDR
jgi:hypothetical protein